MNDLVRGLLGLAKIRSKLAKKYRHFIGGMTFGGTKNDFWLD